MSQPLISTSSRNPGSSQSPQMYGCVLGVLFILLAGLFILGNIREGEEDIFVNAHSEHLIYNLQEGGYTVKVGEYVLGHVDLNLYCRRSGDVVEINNQEVQPLGDDIILDGDSIQYRFGYLLHHVCPSTIRLLIPETMEIFRD